MVIGILGAVFAGVVWRFATGTPVHSFDKLDLGSIVVAFLGAAALLLVLEAIGGGSRRGRR